MAKWTHEVNRHTYGASKAEMGKLASVQNLENLLSPSCIRQTKYSFYFF